MKSGLQLLVITNKIDKPEMALYRGLAQKGLNVDLICMPETPGQPELRAAGINIFSLTVYHRLDRNAIRYIRNCLSLKSYDIVYAPRNNCLSAAIIGSKGFGNKIVGYRGTSGHLSRINPGALLTYFHPKLDAIVCVSEAVRQYLIKKGISPDRLATIYKGHEIDWYDTGVKKDLSEWGIPENAFVVGFVGNIRPVKGIAELIGSMNYLPPTQKTHYLIIGDIRVRSIARKVRSGRLPQNIHFTGFREDASEFMKSFSIFVMPSVEREGFPRALIEAMSQKIAPIVTNVGGMAEIVKNHENGLVVPPRDPAALAKAIEYLALNYEQRTILGQKARDTVRNNFNTHKTIDGMLQLFEKLLADKKNGRI